MNNQSKHGNDFYELKPHMLGLFAILCLYNKNYHFLLPYSGVLFAFASASIFYMRYFSRYIR